MRGDSADKLVVGRITGVYGIKGWVRIRSFMENPESIFDYRNLSVKQGNGWRDVALQQGKAQGKTLVAKIRDCEDRAQASSFVGADIGLPRVDLPPSGEGSYYWHDLIGLEVVNQHDICFGKIEQMVATGANDVMVLRGDCERLIPYIDSVVQRVDMENGRIYVDWEADY